MTPTREAQGALLRALSALAANDSGRALAHALEAARALDEVVRGDHDTAAEVRRVMRHGMEHVSAPIARALEALELEDE